MTPLARALLIIWAPITLVIFVSKRPTYKALIYSATLAWMILPPSGISIPGLPDYTKTTATAFSALLAALLLDGQRIFSFRPKWYDIPIVLFCSSCIATSIINDLGVYDGFSASATMFAAYGIPYFLGRIYLTDQDTLEAAIQALLISSLVMVIPTLWEVRMSPQVQSMLYGTAPSLYDPPRFGLGYRPFLFMSTGLELGLWFAFATIFSYWLTVTKALDDLWGIPMDRVTWGMIALTILTKSVGAIVLTAFGIGILWGVRRTGKSAVLWTLAILPLLYIGLRTSGAWSGDNLVTFTRQYVGVDRASSLQTRFDNENRLIAKAMERPFLGWGGHGRSRVYNESGRDITLTDGMWVIFLGTQGVVGLTGLVLTFVIPQARLIYRTRGARWMSPAMRPAVAAMVFCGLFAADSLLNYNSNPFYFMMIGGLSGYSVISRRPTAKTGAGFLELSEQLIADGSYEEAELVCRKALAEYTPDASMDPNAGVGVAMSYESLARIYELSGHPEGAESALRSALAVWEDLRIPGRPSPAVSEGLSRCYDALARLYKDQGQAREAEECWEASAQALEDVLAGDPSEGDLWRLYADRRNDLAWHLAVPPPTGRSDPITAATLAERATQVFPEVACYWNTLGIARFYAGDDQGAIEALTHSIELSDGGNGFDHYVLSMACVHVGEPFVGRQWFIQGDQWVAAQGWASRDLERVRAEAEAVLLGTGREGETALAPRD